MSALRWREDFNVGIAEIDQEHRELIELINTLQQDLQADSDQLKIVRSLREIYAQIASHFALEEKMMRETHYPSFSDHKEDHEILLDDLRDIMDEIEDDGILDETRLTDDLDRWFSDHFKTHDAKLHRSGHNRD